MRRYAISAFVRGLVFALVFFGTEVRLDCLNWWWSPSVVSRLRLTVQQSAAIERDYQESLPARRRVSEEVFGLTRQIATRIEAGEYDDDSLVLTAKLARPESMERDIRRQMLERADCAPSPEQRQTLSRLAGEKRPGVSGLPLLGRSRAAEREPAAAQSPRP